MTLDPCVYFVFWQAFGNGQSIAAKKMSKGRSEAAEAKAKTEAEGTEYNEKPAGQAPKDYSWDCPTGKWVPRPSGDATDRSTT